MILVMHRSVLEEGGKLKGLFRDGMVEVIMSGEINRT